MSTGDFEAAVRQSVADHLALIATAAEAAKGRIVKSVEHLEQPAPETAAALASFDAASPRPAVDFTAEEPVFSEEPAFAEASAFAESSALPEGAITFDDLAIENVDDEGIPVWEDPP